MMTPKNEEDLCTQILNASRQLFLSSRSPRSVRKGNPKQLEFVLELMNDDLPCVMKKPPETSDQTGRVSNI